jgi:hypothetical protein
MGCPLGLDESGELVVGYAARTLDARAEAAFERHLKSCGICGEAVAAQQAVWDALDEWCSVIQGPASVRAGRTSRIGRPGSLAASVCRPIKSRIVGTKLRLS